MTAFGFLVQPERLWPQLAVPWRQGFAAIPTLCKDGSKQNGFSPRRKYLGAACQKTLRDDGHSLKHKMAGARERCLLGSLHHCCAYSPGGLVSIRSAAHHGEASQCASCHQPAHWLLGSFGHAWWGINESCRGNWERRVSFPACNFLHPLMASISHNFCTFCKNPLNPHCPLAVRHR